jgi:hypothetical protein
VRLCIGATPPPGTSETELDCAPLDGSRHQLLGYRFRDADDDGITVPEEGTLCAGHALPSGYFSESLAAPDCDDPLAYVWRLLDLYADTVGAGVGGGPL